MPPLPELLRRYASTRCDQTFAEIVRRQIDLVYSAALRRLNGDAHFAADATQDVFIALARHADRLARHPALEAWLYTTTRNATRTILRRERRRQRHTDRFATMPSDPPASPEWIELRPFIDGALDALRASERQAILLRFFEGASYRAVADRLSLSEDAARMRVERALEKLRTRLARRGLTSTAATLAAALTSHGVHAAPPHLVEATQRAIAQAALAPATTISLGAWSLKLAAGLTLVVGGVVAWQLPPGNAPERDVPLAHHEGSAAVAPAALAPATAAITFPPSPPASVDAAQPEPPPDGTIIEPITAYGQIAWLVRASTWKNVGRSTIGRIVQSQFAAIRDGDIDYLAHTIAVDAGAQEGMQRLLDSVTPTVRAQYPTPERLAAFLIASGPALTGYALSFADLQGPNEVLVTVSPLLPGADRFSGGRQLFRQSPDGDWTRIISGREISYWSQMIRWDAELSRSRDWRATIAKEPQPSPRRSAGL